MKQNFKSLILTKFLIVIDITTKTLSSLKIVNVFLISIKCRLKDDTGELLVVAILVAFITLIFP